MISPAIARSNIAINAALFARAKLCASSNRASNSANSSSPQGRLTSQAAARMASSLGSARGMELKSSQSHSPLAPSMKSRICRATYLGGRCASFSNGIITSLRIMKAGSRMTPKMQPMPLIRGLEPNVSRMSAPSQQPHSPHTAMPVRAHDDMVMHPDVQPLARFDDLARHINVLTAGFGRSAGVVMHQYDRR